jgi:uncharacterized protein YkwD
MPHRSTIVLSLIAAGAVIVTFAPLSHADNSRFNKAVVSNVYTVQRQAGCTNSLTISPQLQLAAQWHTDDVLNNRNLDGDIGSDGSTPQDRARAAGFAGNVAETVAINPALAISGIELINTWYYDPHDMAIMRDCANTKIGVWSENSLDRTVVVAVYGQPSSDTGVRVSATSAAQEAPPDPILDYDASDEIEYGIDWFPWILRGVYPPPAYPSQ